RAAAARIHATLPQLPVAAPKVSAAEVATQSCPKLAPRRPARNLIRPISLRRAEDSRATQVRESERVKQPKTPEPGSRGSTQQVVREPGESGSKLPGPAASTTQPPASLT